MTEVVLTKSLFFLHLKLLFISTGITKGKRESLFFVVQHWPAVGQAGDCTCLVCSSESALANYSLLLSVINLSGFFFFPFSIFYWFFFFLSDGSSSNGQGSLIESKDTSEMTQQLSKESYFITSLIMFYQLFSFNVSVYILCIWFNNN